VIFRRARKARFREAAGNLLWACPVVIFRRARGARSCEAAENLLQGLPSTTFAVAKVVLGLHYPKCL